MSSKNIVHDRKLFLTEHDKHPMYQAPDNGFLSDHTILTMTTSRAHSSLDILNDWVIDLIEAVACLYLMRRSDVIYVNSKDAYY